MALRGKNWKALKYYGNMSITHLGMGKKGMEARFRLRKSMN